MSGGGGGGSRAAVIPPGARRTVQRMKEIVNCPEAEIYAMLQECNMDPAEAVQRLLSQDTFHEVKSKREKKKETKETPESWSRSASNSSYRGFMVGNDRGGNINSTQFSSNDDGVTRGKPIFKKENASNSFPTSSILGPGVPANNTNGRSRIFNGSASGEIMTQVSAGHDGVSLSSQPSAVSQHNWVGGPGHVTMADIVKRGRPQGMPSSAPISASNTSYISSAVMSAASAKGSLIGFPTLESNLDLQSSQDLVSKAPEINHVTGTPADQHLALVKESTSGSWSAVQEAYPTSAFHDGSYMLSTLLVDGVNALVNPHLDGIRVPEANANDENLLVVSSRPTSSSDGSLDNTDSFQSQRHVFECHEVEDGNAEISSASASMQKLALHEEELCSPSVGHHPALIIPKHLQVTDADCSHLSFGSFGSGANAKFSGSFPSNPLKSNLEFAPISDDAIVVDQLETRDSEDYDDGQLSPTFDANIDTRTGTETRNYDTPSSTQPDIIRNDALNATHVLQYNIPSVSGYSLPTTTQASVATYTYPQTNSQMKSLVPLSSLMQPYNNTPLPSNPFPSMPPSVRNFEPPLSPFLTAHAMPTNGQPSSMREVVKPRIFSSVPTQQTLPSTSIPTGLSPLQHLPVQQFPQSNFPLSHFANTSGYKFLPHSYTYMPSAAFPQTYTGNASMHQSLGALQNAGINYNPLQYKSSVPTGNLPQSAAVPPGYGGFGTSIPGSYTMNPTSLVSSTINEALSSQYKEGNHYIVQQGARSGTMPTLPASTLYSILSQGQHSGFRQDQQPSPLPNLGYANMYQFQAGVYQEHQRNPSEGNLNGSLGAQSQQSNQMWQRRY